MEMKSKSPHSQSSDDTLFLHPQMEKGILKERAQKTIHSLPAFQKLERAVEESLEPYFRSPSSKIQDPKLKQALEQLHQKQNTLSPRKPKSISDWVQRAYSQTRGTTPIIKAPRTQ